jgi:hypothetical protein
LKAENRAYPVPSLRERENAPLFQLFSPSLLSLCDWFPPETGVLVIGGTNRIEVGAASRSETQTV